MLRAGSGEGVEGGKVSKGAVCAEGLSEGEEAGDWQDIVPVLRRVLSGGLSGAEEHLHREFEVR